MAVINYTKLMKFNIPLKYASIYMNCETEFDSRNVNLYTFIVCNIPTIL